ncbi:MAG: hypothetical protein Q9180_008838, partial [Flavoplaca navasiana]
KLTDLYENRMEFTERLKPIAVNSLNECIQENQQVKTAIEVNSARSRKMINILREICIDNPLEAREVFSEDVVVKQYVEATQDEIQSLELREDNLDNVIRLRFDSVRQEMVQEYHNKDYKVTFDDCVAASRAATTTAQATAEQGLKEVIEALQHERDVTRRKDEEVRILTFRLQKSNQHLTTERESVAKRDDMIKSLKSQHPEKICQSILEYSIQQQSLFQHDKQARDEVWAALMEEKQKIADEKQKISDLVITAEEKMRTLSNDVNQARERIQSQVR